MTENSLLKDLAFVASASSQAVRESLRECEENAKREIAQQWETASKIEAALERGEMVWIEWETKDRETLRHFSLNADYLPSGSGWARQGLNETKTGKVLLCAWCHEVGDFRMVTVSKIMAWGFGDCQDEGRQAYGF